MGLKAKIERCLLARGWQILAGYSIAPALFLCIRKTRSATPGERSQHTPSQSLGATTPLMRVSYSSPGGATRPGTASTANPATPISAASQQLPSVSPVILAESRPISEEELQRRSLSFTAAGQVLSRIEVDAAGNDDESEDEGRSDDSRSSSEEQITTRRSPTPSSRGHPSRSGSRASQRVQVVGSFVSRMSTIDSVGTNVSGSERGSPVFGESRRR